MTLAQADSERAEKLVAASVISRVQHETATSTTAPGRIPEAQMEQLVS